MNFEAPFPKKEQNAKEEGESKKTQSRIGGVVAGAVFSMGLMAGQAAEAQAAPSLEKHEQIEKVASGTLSHSKEQFIVALKKEAAKNAEKLGACENIVIRVGSVEFACSYAKEVVSRGATPAKVRILGKSGDREIEFTFQATRTPEQMEKLKHVMTDILLDTSHKPMFHYYTDSKHENVKGDSMHPTLTGLFRLENVELHGPLEKYR